MLLRPALLVLVVAACGDVAPLEPIPGTAAPPDADTVVARGVAAPAAVSYDVRMTVHERAPDGRLALVRRARRSVGVTRRAVAGTAPHPAASGGASLALWEAWLLRDMRRPAGSLRAGGPWKEERRLPADPSVLVVAEGIGRAPAATTSFYRAGALVGRMREQWRLRDREWEIVRRELDFPAGGIVLVAEFASPGAPAAGAFTLGDLAAAPATAGPRRPGPEGPAAFACTEEDAASLCADKRLAAEQLSQDLAWHLFYTMLECGATLVLAPTGAAGFIAGTLCAGMVFHFYVLSAREQRAWRDYRTCLNKALGGKAVVTDENLLGARAPALTAGVAPGAALLTPRPSFDISECGDAGGGGGGNGDVEGADGTICWWHIVVDNDTQIILEATLLFCTP